MPLFLNDESVSKFFESTKEKEVTLNVDFYVVDGIPQLSDDSYTFNQSSYYDKLLPPVTINVSNSGDYDNIEWVDEFGSPFGSGDSITLTNTNPDHLKYLALGTHIFTIIVDVGGVPYSADFTLTVN